MSKPSKELSKALIFKNVCENDFAFFCKQYVKVIEPETKFIWNWHLDVLCKHCEMVFYGKMLNLDINIPPRMMKSLIITVLFPCWIWTKKPQYKILSASRSYELAIKFNKQRRDLIRSEKYMQFWSVPIKDDTDKADEFANYLGGFMKAVSAGGQVTGSGADMLLSDDLLDANHAFSKAKRDAVNLWYSQAFYNRAQNKKAVKRINVNQRLHIDDPSGNIAKHHNFKTLVLPMVKMESDESTVEFRDPRQVGEYLFPERYGPDEMADDYKALGVYGWSAQYQQTPRPIGGGIIKEEWIRYYTEEPYLSRKIIVADLSFKGSKKSDYVSFQYWGVEGGKKYLLDLVRGKWSYKETKEKFKAFCDRNPASLKFIEDKANGPAMLSDFKDEIRGLRAWPPEGSKYMNADKVQRLHMVSQDYENGDVYLPKNIELTKLFVEELVSFTEKGSATGNDDMVDTSTMALLELRKALTFAG